ncbi:hypothetical protein [Vibrio sp. SCSIO 43137]|uniref:hypothetical protein n=1 Tax=Vibrio sp. SCSIO 43137 TaxID=3021011 RepID=UPI0023073227|nr:hypothetical protein [Vibrio sp. SCSIO 43137]WCE31112.1 hypothetical protein PK654_07560 [Vibrio sp. SCSIO 43137]
MARIQERRWQSGDRRLWHGSADSIPKGWVIDGDTLDRAIVGAGGTHQSGAQFGEDTKRTNAHTLSEAQIPYHYHLQAGVISDGYEGAAIYGVEEVGGGFREDYGNVPYGASHPRTSSKGGSQAHDHGNMDVRQKSVALYVIRKL